MRRFVLVGITIAVLLVGCSSVPAPASSVLLAGQSGMDQIAGTWVPQRPTASATPGPMECPASLALGRDGFWRAMGPYLADGSWILDDDGAMRVVLPDGYGSGSYPYCEVAYAVVQDVTTAVAAELDDGVLVLRSADGAVTGRMVRTSDQDPTPEPMSSESAAPSLPSGFVGEWVGEGWDVRLTEDLLVSGAASCNELRGRWSDSGLPFFFALRSLRDCDVEQGWTTLTSATLDGDEMLLTADDGSTISLRRAPVTG